MTLLKGRTPTIAVLCALIFCFTIDATRSVAGKEPIKETDLYAKEVVRHKSRVTVSKAFVNAVRKNNAIVLSKAAVRQRVGKGGGLEAWELVEIDKGSSIEKMGFKSGDRIKSVNGIPVGELADRRSEIETSSSWELLVYRHGKPRKMLILLTP